MGGGGAAYSRCLSLPVKNSKKWGGGKVEGQTFFRLFYFFSSMGTRFFTATFYKYRTKLTNNCYNVYLYGLNLQILQIYILYIVWFGFRVFSIYSALTVSSVVEMAIQVRSCVE